MFAKLFTRLNDIREIENKRNSAWLVLVCLFLIFILGALMGFLAEYADYVDYSPSRPYFFGTVIGREIGWALSMIGKYFSLWIFTATLIAAYSKTPVRAGNYVCIFFLAMVGVFYSQKTQHYVFYSNQFVLWIAIAVFSLFAAMILWYSRGKGWASAVIAAAPVSAIIAELVYIMSEHGTPPLFSLGKAIYYAALLLFALILIIALPKGKQQRLRTCLISIVLCPGFYFVLRALL